MELPLTQADGNKLISLAKKFTQKYKLELKDGERYILKASTTNGRIFKIFIQYATKNVHINFWDEITKLSLVRFNLNDSFHKNANGKIIRGNRVNLFCEDEFNIRKDGQYMRAFKLPYKDILKNPTSFDEALEEMLKYVNVINYKDKLNIQPKLI